MLPVGPGEEFLSVYELDYQPPVAGKKEGITRVKNTDGTATVYHFSEQLLTSLIEYYGTEICSNYSRNKKRNSRHRFCVGGPVKRRPYASSSKPALFRRGE